MECSLSLFGTPTCAHILASIICYQSVPTWTVGNGNFCQSYDLYKNVKENILITLLLIKTFNYQVKDSYVFIFRAVLASTDQQVRRN